MSHRDQNIQDVLNVLTPRRPAQQEFFEFQAEDSAFIEGPPIPDSPRISPAEFGAAIEEDLRNDIKQKVEANKDEELPHHISIFKKPKEKEAEAID